MFEFRLIGFFDQREPVYFARDSEFLRQITIKDFDNFEDHVGFIDSDSDALFGKSLFLLSEKKWRDMRTTLSPAFTGAKMRHMFELVVECAEDMSKHFVAEAKNGQSIQWEMKELYSRYTSDVIASVKQSDIFLLISLVIFIFIFMFLFSAHSDWRSIHSKIKPMSSLRLERAVWISIHYKLHCVFCSSGHCPL